MSNATNYYSNLKEDYARLSMEISNTVNQDYLESLARQMANNVEKQEQFEQANDY